MPPKPGDAVLYEEGDKLFEALVFNVHFDQPTHLGANGEPLLDLVIVDPDAVVTVGRVRPIDRVKYISDAVHQSHPGFSDEYRRKHGLQTDAQAFAHAGVGRWFSVMDQPIVRPELIGAAKLEIVPPPEVAQAPGSSGQTEGGPGSTQASASDLGT